MSLKIYYSDRIEDLAEHLKERLLEERRRAGVDPFEFSQVVVPNTNIAKWLKIKVFVNSPELCMGLEFPFIEQRLFGLLSESVGEEKRLQLLPDHAYANAIMSILLKDDDEMLAPFRRYVAEGVAGPLVIDSRSKARMAWQLAVKLADLMDKYEVHREEIVRTWLDEKLASDIKDPTAIAEAALARKLFGNDGVFPPTGDRLSLRQLFERVSKSQPRTTGRPIYVFGISTLSSLQARILHWLAKTNEVIVYHNNVCLEYWGDIEAVKERKCREDKMLQRLRASKDADADVNKIENELLCKWGVAGRETLRLLVDLEELNGSSDEPVDFEWNEVDPRNDDQDVVDSVLGKVQGSIRHRLSDVGHVEKQDASIQIVGAPGIRREVEMVYNAILGAVWKPNGSGDRPWGDCTFSDIAVLVPDMATYRPVIEAVFDARDQIPYGLIDSTASDSSAYLSGFRALMSLARDGLSRETVFEVLDNACVQNALGFTAKDVREWRRYAKEIGAFDGFGEEERAQKVSWNVALSRLRLGRVANEVIDPCGKDDLVVWQGGEDSALKFSEIVEMLYRELSPLADAKLLCVPAAVPKDVKGEGQNWAECLRRITGEFLAAGRDEPLEASVGRQISQTLYALEKIEGRQCLDFVVEAVEEFVGGIKCQHGGYLTHGVTIAGLQPMRPVPFKQVFVLGMGEGLFPGHDSETTLEIRGAQRRLGDIRPSQVKKYLFLETLMATRERLVLSYPCLDIVKDAELFPSGMVCELKSFVENGILPEGQKFKEVKLPLLERGEPDKPLEEDPVAQINWTGEWFAGILPTYSKAERGLAGKIVAKGKQLQDASANAFHGESAAEDGKDSSVCPPRQTIAAKELSEFLESPLRAVLRRLHGINVEGYRDESIDPDAPLEIASGPTEWEFQRAVLKAVPDKPAETDIDGVYRRFANRGCVPQGGGLLGNYALAKAKDKLLKDAESLGALKCFVKAFLPEGWIKPDPVRTPVPAKKGDAEKYKRGELLFTGQTSGWLQSSDGTECRALLFNKCGDERSGGGKQAKFPPKAVLEPLVTWLMMVAGMSDEKTYSLIVGIADIKELTYNAWRWSITLKDASTYLDVLVDEYLQYLDSPDGDGAYIDFGYSDLVDAIVAAKDKEKIAGDFPETKEEWEALEFKGDDDYGKTESSFDNDLVIGETMKAWSRMPDEEDIASVKDRFDRLHKLPMTGVRDCPQGKTEEA